MCVQNRKIERLGLHVDSKHMVEEYHCFDIIAYICLQNVINVILTNDYSQCSFD